jgi:YfiR/HmsC-like
MKKLLILLFYLGFIGLHTADAQNEKFKALFMYNFTKYIEWPANLRQGDFVIDVLGNPALALELQTIASKLKVGTQNIVIKAVSSIDEIDNCHVLYISSGKSGQLGNALAKLNGKNALIITDKEGLALQGAGINYIMDGDKLRYEINRGNIEKKGLVVSNSLLTLGVAVSN